MFPISIFTSLLLSGFHNYDLYSSIFPCQYACHWPLPAAPHYYTRKCKCNEWTVVLKWQHTLMICTYLCLYELFLYNIYAQASCFSPQSLHILSDPQESVCILSVCVAVVHFNDVQSGPVLFQPWSLMLSTGESHHCWFPSDTVSFSSSAAAHLRLGSRHLMLYGGEIRNVDRFSVDKTAEIRPKEVKSSELKWQIR